MLIVHMTGERTRYIVGCMSGTSLDGLDAVLAEVKGEGLGIRVRFVAMNHAPLGELGHLLRRVAEGAATTPIHYLRAARELGMMHVQAIRPLLEGCEVDFVACHGQTVWHAPAEGLSWQLMDPWPIVRELQLPVCYDLRQADLIAGGQGAPMTPITDWIMYRDPKRNRRVANLGGICNVTDLPAGGSIDAVTGCDIGPCNLLIDGIVRHVRPDLRFDVDGALAMAGTPDGMVYERMMEADFFRRPLPRTTGREDFGGSWIDDLMRGLRLPPHDAAASAVDAVARLIAESVADADLILAGGGARNRALVNAIRLRARHARISDELGIPAEAREAMAFAVLGALAQDKVSISLPQVTGAINPGRAGAWVYP
jgi:1,6-anhydro-N-acetylmuramate kinase